MAQISERDWLNILGGELRERLGVKQRQVEFEQAAKAGDVRAIVVVAGAYLAGVWGPPDAVKALELARRAAAQGDARGMATAGQILSRTPGADGEARAFFEQSARKGSALAAAFLADMVAAGRGGPADPARAAALNRTAAEAGVVPAMTSFAFALVNGEGVAKDEAAGAAWAARAAEKGNADAMRLLGILSENGTGLPKDAAVATGWYAKAAAAGSADAARMLAERYQSGAGVAKDMTRAVQLYQQAASAGDIKAAARLGALYGGDLLGKPDYPMAEKWLKQAVEGGDLQSVFLLGLLYRDDQAGMADPAKAAALFLQAANAGNLTAMADYGRLQALGSGVPKDVAAGLAWINKAAAAGNEQAKTYLAQFQNWQGTATVADGIDAVRAAATAGNIVAMRRLAIMLANGEGVAKDETDAAGWALKAANAGDAEAMRLMGILSYFGRGIAKDGGVALGWFRKSAEAGNARAMAAYAEMLAKGTAGSANPAAAVPWYQKAADAGVVSAMTDLAGLLEEGNGVAKDIARAEALFRKAAAASPVDSYRLGLFLWRQKRHAEVPGLLARAVTVYKQDGNAGQYYDISRRLIVFHVERNNFAEARRLYDDVAAVEEPIHDMVAWAKLQTSVAEALDSQIEDLVGDVLDDKRRPDAERRSAAHKLLLAAFPFAFVTEQQRLAVAQLAGEGDSAELIDAYFVLAEWVRDEAAVDAVEEASNVANRLGDADLMRQTIYRRFPFTVRNGGYGSDNPALKSRIRRLAYQTLGLARSDDNKRMISRVAGYLALEADNDQASLDLYSEAVAADRASGNINGELVNLQWLGLYQGDLKQWANLRATADRMQLLIATGKIQGADFYTTDARLFIARSEEGFGRIAVANRLYLDAEAKATTSQGRVKAMIDLAYLTWNHLKDRAGACRLIQAAAALERPYKGDRARDEVGKFCR